MRRIAPCLVAAAGAILAVSVFGAAAASASSNQPTSVGATYPIPFSATTGGDTTLQIDVVIHVELLRSRDEVPKVLPTLPAGEIYSEVRLQTSAADARDLPIVLPVRAATLRTPAGTASPSRGSSDGAWYFPIASSSPWVILTMTTTAETLPVRAPDGQVTTRTIQPAVIGFFIPPRGRGAPPPNNAATPFVFVIGGIVVIAAGAGLNALRRRRAFYRADREGRVVLVGPPVTAAEIEGPPPDALTRKIAESVVVKILGWLEITRVKRGSERAVAASGPVSEILVFLVLNPGRTFTSIQLREAIWGLGRSPLSSGTFRKYMVELRKTLGIGVVVTERYRYELTTAVVSDLARFRAALSNEDRFAGPEAALELVRGPVLNGSFDGKKNSPFAWAVDTATAIEDDVTSVAYDLARAYLQEEDPERATRALARGLLCSTTNLRLRLLELEIGLALGGAAELTRRLAAGRAAMGSFPDDVRRLEESAFRLGGDALRK